MNGQFYEALSQTYGKPRSGRAGLIHPFLWGRNAVYPPGVGLAEVERRAGPATDEDERAHWINVAGRLERHGASADGEADRPRP